MTKHGWEVTLGRKCVILRGVVNILALLGRRGVFGLDAQSLLEFIHGELVALDDFAGVDLVGGLGAELVGRSPVAVLD